MLIDSNGKPIMPQAAKMFPAFIQFGPKIKVFLNLDGTCHGDLEEALEAIGNMPPGPELPVMWFFARAINDQLHRNTAMGDLVSFTDIDFEDTAE